MKLKTFAAAAAVIAAPAGPALADPWMALDANPNILVVIDRGSIQRYGAIRTAQNLYVLKGRQPVVFTVRYNCDMRTYEEIDQRLVARTLTLGAPIPGKSGTNSAPPGSLGDSLMVNVCQDKVVNTSAGWTRPDLKGVIDAAIAIGYVPVWP
jgi:hypothetical protein